MADDFENEFFQGMESGFFLRDTPDGYKEYDCPDIAVDPEQVQTVNSFVQPVIMAVKLLKKPIFEQVVEAIQGFLEEVMFLQALFSNYKGTEFCGGILFGIHGSKLMMGLVRAVFSAADSMMNDAMAKGRKGLK